MLLSMGVDFMALCTFFGLSDLWEEDRDSTLAHIWASSSIYRRIDVTFPQLQVLRAVSKNRKKVVTCTESVCQHAHLLMHA